MTNKRKENNVIWIEDIAMAILVMIIILMLILCRGWRL